MRSSPLLLAGMFLAALALRPQLVGVGPLLSTIAHVLHISHSVAGLLSTAIVLCMGVFTRSRSNDPCARRTVRFPLTTLSSLIATWMCWSRHGSLAAGLDPQAGNVRRPLVAR